LRTQQGMPKTTTSLETPLRRQLDKLAAFEPTDLPVISLYLDMRPDQQGKRQIEQFIRKTFGERQKTFASGSPERLSFDEDTKRITDFLAEDVERSAQALAVFACHGASLFETIPMNAPIKDHWLFIGAVPHLYPLARVSDQYPRYAALVVDTNSARLFVFSLGVAESQRDVKNVKTRKTSMGGWSQARYQRHAENFHAQHMKEVVDVLDRVVRDESINQIVVSCDEVTKPLLANELPKHLAEKVVATIPLDIKAPEHEVLQETLEALREKDAATDQERVAAMIGAWRGSGLAVAGPEDTLEALQRGQVEELLITATPAALRRTSAVPQGTTPGPVDVDTSGPGAELDTERLKLSDELVTKAHATNARVRFIEDSKLLSEVGGVGAVLRFKI
jgi:peptide subunit release factor 1 (eRF1)